MNLCCDILWMSPPVKMRYIVKYMYVREEVKTTKRLEYEQSWFLLQNKSATFIPNLSRFRDKIYPPIFSTAKIRTYLLADDDDDWWTYLWLMMWYLRYYDEILTKSSNKICLDTIVLRVKDNKGRHLFYFKKKNSRSVAN